MNSLILYPGIGIAFYVVLVIKSKIRWNTGNSPKCLYLDCYHSSTIYNELSGKQISWVCNSCSYGYQES